MVVYVPALPVELARLSSQYLIDKGSVVIRRPIYECDCWELVYGTDEQGTNVRVGTVGRIN